MLKKFVPQEIDHPVCQIEIENLKIMSNSSSDIENENGISLYDARERVRNGEKRCPFFIEVSSKYMSLSLEDAEEIIKGLQSMVNYLRS